MTPSNIIPLHRATELPAEWYAEHLQIDRWPSSGPGARHIVIGAMPTARAADASHSSLVRVSTRGGIAIAALCIIIFGAEFLR